MFIFVYYQRVLSCFYDHAVLFYMLILSKTKTNQVDWYEISNDTKRCKEINPVQVCEQRQNIFSLMILFKFSGEIPWLVLWEGDPPVTPQGAVRRSVDVDVELQEIWDTMTPMWRYCNVMLRIHIRNTRQLSLFSYIIADSHDISRLFVDNY